MMKKKVRFIVVPLLIVCVLLSAFAFGCSGGSRLDVPQNIEINLDNYEITWSRVDNASGYEVEIVGKDGTKDSVTTTRTHLSASLEYLEEGDYDVRVRATASSSSRFTTSRWSSVYAFTKDYYSGCVYTLINNDTEYEITGWSKPSKGSADIMIYGEYRGKPVIGIADKAFQGKQVTSVTIEGDNLRYIGEKAFYSCSYLESITLPDSVESIGSGAFHSCRLIKEFKMPAGVTEIEDSTFLYCRSLESFDFGNVTSIGDSAFYGCNQGLKAVTIPDAVTKIGDDAFGLCEVLESVEIGCGCETIGEYAFEYDAALSSVKFLTDEDGKAALTEIGAYSFSYCKAIENVTIPQGVETISNYAFYGDTSLCEVNIPVTVTKMGRNAFKNAKFYDAQEDEMFVYAGKDIPSDAEGDNRLWVLYFNESVAEEKGVTENIEEEYFEEGTIGIADRAFYGASLTGSLVIPEYVQYIGERAFYSSKFWSVMLKGSASSNPDDQHPVYIDSYAFSQMKSLNTVQFSDSTNPAQTTNPAVKSIGSYAFYNSTSVSGTIRISETLEHIGAYAFKGTSVASGTDGVKYVGTTGSTSSIKWAVGYTFDEESSAEAESVKINLDGTTGIADYAFKEAVYITGIENLNTVKYIGEGAFYKCESLTAAVLGDDITEIPDYAFYGCSALERLGSEYETVYRDLERVGRSAFYNCKSLAQFNFSGTKIDYIGKYAFYGCTGLSDLILNEDLFEIDDYAFYKAGVRSLTLPSSLERIGQKAFYKCESLESLTIEAGEETSLEIGDYAFYKCTSLEGVDIPGNVKDIGKYAFYKCDALSYVKLREGVETIGEGAFAYADITSLTIPSSVREIGKYAFRGCTSLKSVVIPSTVEVIGDYAFYGLSDATFYTDMESLPGLWSSRLNASNRPMVWGCKLSEDGTYVYSVEITGDTFSDVVRVEATDESDEYMRLCAAPEREGYEFLGWATSSGGDVVYAADEIDLVPVGTVLYSVWAEIEEPETEAGDDTENEEDENGEVDTGDENPGDTTIPVITQLKRYAIKSEGKYD